MTSTSQPSDALPMEVNPIPTRLSGGRTLFGEDAKTIASTLKQHMDQKNAEINSPDPQVTKKKGTLAGVFIPTCEGMWGVLIFLKFSYVVGIGGVGHALIAVFVSFIAALCTTICVSAIASSGGVVSEGGPYYMISRSLGPYIGVSVGVCYWIGITFLGVMEAVGAVYALKLIFVDTFEFTWATQALGSAFMAVLSLFVFGGINLVTKLGVIFGVIVFLTIVFYYVSLGLAPLADHNPSPYLTGLNIDTLRNNWAPAYPEGLGFGTTMSLFFPCFTGILSGADRADVLRDPPRNIKYGTMAAITFSLLMYASFMVLWGAVAERCWLIGDCPTTVTAVSNVVRRLAGADTHSASEMAADQLLWPGKYVTMTGVLISCCSQTLQCLIVAPRLLRAIAADSLIPFLRPLGVLSKRGEPARALLVTYIFSAGLVLIGSVDVLAPMVTISFLVCYGFLNIACLMLTILRSPTWRPTGIFHLRWRVFYIVFSVLGFLACLAIALVVSRYWTVGIIFFAILLYWYVASRGEEAEWGSGLDGLRYGLAMSALLGLKREQHRKINWRPQLLALLPLGDVETESTLEDLDSSSQQDQLIQFCGQLRKGRGMTVVAGVLENCPETRNKTVSDRLKLEREKMEKRMARSDITGFAEVVTAASWREGASYVCQLSGLGGLRPNTLVIPWPAGWRENPQLASDYVRIISLALAEEKAVVCPQNLSALPLGDKCPDQTGYIDLWWFITDGGLLVLLTWLLAQHRVWRNCAVRVFVVVENVGKETAENAAETVRNLFKEKRILANVTVEAVVLADEMIHPYTYDLTLKMDQRKNAMGHSDIVPHSLDELFLEKPPTAASSRENFAHVVIQESQGKRDKLKRVLSKVLHPRRSLNDMRKRKAGEATVVRSVSQAFARKDAMITQENERDLLDTLNDRCRLRRQELDAERIPSERATTSEDEEECESVLGDLLTPSPLHDEHGANGNVFERLNQVILSRSKDSSLVLMNLPDVWGTDVDDCASYLAFCECLVKGLDKVVFVHSSGTEVVRIF